MRLVDAIDLGFFYEGTRISGRSALLAIQPETGKPPQKRECAPQYLAAAHPGSGSLQ